MQIFFYNKLKNYQMKKKTIKIPIYDGKLILYQVDNWDFINQKYEHPDPLTNRTCGTVLTNYTKSGNSEYIVAFNSVPLNSVIAHEAKHVVNLIFRDRGILLDVDNDEPEAYFLDWVFEQIEKFFKIT